MQKCCSKLKSKCLCLCALNTLGEQGMRERVKVCVCVCVCVCCESVCLLSSGLLLSAYHLNLPQLGHN